MPRSHKQKAEGLDSCSPGHECQPDLPQRSRAPVLWFLGRTQWPDPRPCAQQAQEGLWSRCRPRAGLPLRVAVTSPGRGPGTPAADALHLCASSRLQPIPSQSSKTQSSPFGIGTSHTYPADPSSYSPLSSPATSSPSGNAYSSLANRTPGFGRWGRRERMPGSVSKDASELSEFGDLSPKLPESWYQVWRFPSASSLWLSGGQSCP